MQRSLHGRRARRGDHDIGRGEHVVGTSLDDGNVGSETAQTGRSGRFGARATTNCTPLTRARMIGWQTRPCVVRDALQLVRAAPGQQSNGRRVRPQAESRRGKAIRGCSGASEIDERMSDKLNRDSSALVHRRFERKDDEHLVNEPLHRLDAVRPPRPHLRAHVIDNGNAEPPQSGHQPKIESRKIDSHEDVGPARTSIAHESAIHPPRSRQHRDDFCQPGYREAGERALSAWHRPPADAGRRGQRSRPTAPARAARPRARPRTDHRTARRTKS